ncbi:YhjD/YihY/BrkB family envelope integrity protein [Naumannella halotolerans]|uniref:Membrane protein n=1 Tax=Naumannella halotolerans TaxID=993414 RepID=A0A4R7J8Z7_9ACTN|nr:YhjD/YihY/BrkB family envelope integrity protein [Naumannella halotolerans]TDT33316.1 membrane protein [Naumannella halotolerans]
MSEKVEEVQRKPWIAHLLRANTRYGTRLGAQFAAAITYFSVLSLVPIIMFAFATTGFIVSRDEGLQALITEQIGVVLEGAPMAEELSAVILEAFTNWVGVGIVAVLSGAYSGAGWIGNIKSAIRAQMRPSFDMTEQKKNIVLETLVNLGLLVIFLLILVLTFALSQVATSLTNVIIGVLGLEQIPYITLLFRAVPVVASLVAGFILFQFIFRVFPEYRPPNSALAKGALAGAVGLAILQYLLGTLISIFSGNAAASVFGPVIALMLFFNLFAQLILRLAGWIATANQWAVAGEEQIVDEALEDSDVEVLTPEKFAADRDPDEPDPEETAESTREQSNRPRWTPPYHPKPVDLDDPDGAEPVSSRTAARGVRVGMAGGWLLGIGSGLGLGALVTAIVSRFRG